jgi:hypothetical protein
MLLALHLLPRAGELQRREKREREIRWWCVRGGKRGVFLRCQRNEVVEDVDGKGKTKNAKDE